MDGKGKTQLNLIRDVDGKTSVSTSAGESISGVMGFALIRVAAEEVMLLMVRLPAANPKPAPPQPSDTASTVQESSHQQSS